MCRWFVIFLLVLLPAQATWAVVAGYCIHKPGVAESHFGHHEHASHYHAPMLDEASSSVPGANSESAAGVNHDCGHCHGHFAGIPLDVQPLRLDQARSSSVAISEDSLTAHTAVRPERPKWVRLA